MADQLQIHLDSAALRRVLQGSFDAELRGHAEAIASEVRTRFHVDCVVEYEEGDRQRAVVVVKEAYGMALQAKYGALTRAAASRGLEVRAG